MLDSTVVNAQLLEDCGSLLEVRRSPSSSYELHTVHLTHFTIKEYLVSHMPLPGIPMSIQQEKGSVNEEKQSLALGKICLQYINSATVWRQAVPIQRESDQAQQSLREYAAGSWYKHAAAVQPIGNEMTDLINKFLDPNNTNWISWKNWFQPVNKNGFLDQEIHEEAGTPLYYASLFELPGTVQHLLQESGYKQDHKTIAAALRAACRIGNLKALSILLESGARESIVDTAGNSAIHIASRRGHVEMVKLLLDEGADWSVLSNNGWTLLNSAANNGHVNVVKLVLDNGADWSIPNNNG
ncbi:hypothetical protein TruAng_011593 [Truncatella angustata]|nr:hypothetical protein TruAng_011593 [Truncatella angustata]